jgi:hypothetical protein
VGSCVAGGRMEGVWVVGRRVWGSTMVWGRGSPAGRRLGDLGREVSGAGCLVEGAFCDYMGRSL